MKRAPFILFTLSFLVTVLCHPISVFAEDAPQGKILSPVSGQMDTYDADMGPGIEIGDVVQVLRDGKDIATGVVITAGSQKCRIVLKGNAPTCRAGDIVKFLKHKKVHQVASASSPGGAPDSSKIVPSVNITLVNAGNPESGLTPGSPGRVSFTYKYSGRDRTVNGFVIFSSFSPAPAVIFAQGVGVKAEEEMDTLELIKKAGFTGMVLDYSDHIDVVAAAMFLQERSFVAPGKIGLMGYSLGAKCVVAAAEYCKGLKAVVEISGRFLVDGQVLTSANQSPLTYASSISCPIYIIHGGKDSRVPVENANALQKKLSELGKTSQIRIVENEDHGFSNWNDVLEDGLRFLRQYL